QSLVGDWSGGDVSTASPASDFSLTYGNTFGRLGVVLSGTSNHGYAIVEEQQRFFGVDAGVLVPANDYTLDTDRESASAGFIANVSYKLTDANRIFLNSVLTRDALSEDRVQEGLQSASGGNIRDYRVRYQLEEMFSS